MLASRRTRRVTLQALYLALLAAAAARGAPPAAVEVEPGITLPRPATWAMAPESPSDAVLLLALAATAPAASYAQVMVTTEHRASHEDALLRLTQIASGHRDATTTWTVVGGWPAVERRYRVPFLPFDEHGGPPERAAKLVRITMAVAAGATVVRLDGTLSKDAPARLVDEVAGAARTLVFAAPGRADAAQRDTERLARLPPGARLQAQPSPVPCVRPPGPRPSPHPRRGGRGGPPRAIVLAGDSSGELEIAASKDGRTVVVASQTGTITSTDSGATFASRRSIPFPWVNLGDPSVDVGASGSFYASWLGDPDGSASALGKDGCAVEVSRSPDGQSFSFVGHAFRCRADGAELTDVPPLNGHVFVSCSPDQEHIAADHHRVHAGKDLVYAVARMFTTVSIGTRVACSDIDGGYPYSVLACSSDGGATWGPAKEASWGDRAHVTVDDDGFVYVTTRDGGQLDIDKFSSCVQGLRRQNGFPVQIADGLDEPSCPVAGLDRCADTLQSGMIVDAGAGHLVATYAQHSSDGNENIRVHDSFDGGRTWSGGRTVSSRQRTARRFFPWACAMDGRVFVGWYDRGLGKDPLLGNDLTDYLVGVVNPVGDEAEGPEFRMSRASDPQCALWPAPPRSEDDAESCLLQPEKAGTCSEDPTRRCDYSSGCGNAGSCDTTNQQTPKYGDYDGFACANGRLYAAFASATAQPGAAAPPAGRIPIFVAALEPPTLSVSIKNVLPGGSFLPSGTPFMILVDDAVRRRGVSSGNDLIDVVLGAGSHHVRIATMPHFEALRPTVTFSGDCSTGGMVNLDNGDRKSCLATNVIPYRNACTVTCNMAQDRCKQQHPGGDSDRDCVQRHRECLGDCASPP